MTQKIIVASHIQTSGGTVDDPTPGGFLLQATLTPAQLLSVVYLNEVAFVGRWSPPQVAMDNARAVGHANFVQHLGGFTGQGVIGEVVDTNLELNPPHPAFGGTCSGDGGSCVVDDDCTGQGQTCDGAPILHGNTYSVPPPEDVHGTNVFGILFGDGTGIDRQLDEFEVAKGMLPDAQGIFANLCRLWGCSPEEIAQVDRSCHTCELVYGASVCQLAPDAPCLGPNDYQVEGPFDAVFQSNSWGNGYGILYSARTLELDDILFTYDIVSCQAQGNAGDSADPSYSLLEAWAKNTVSVGGVWHYNTLPTNDHSWDDKRDCDNDDPVNPCDPPQPEMASTGPAADGRIKPDFTHFFDSVYTTTFNGAYRDNFGGTSAATPITCGYFGLFFQMWAEGIFRPVPECDAAMDHCVFINRPHMSTAKAMMINTARAYPMPLGLADDLSRYHQGWGLADVGKLYLLRNQFLLIRDQHEDDVLERDKSKSFQVNVEANTYALKVTLVYTDPAATVGELINLRRDRVNDLNLEVTSPPPGSSRYRGNNGLLVGNWSTTSNAQDRKDTVENVFVQNPDAGTWRVEVFADEINQDGHVETPALDVDFALIVSVDMDCNQNNESDADEILFGQVEDTNNNGVPDECDPAPAHTAPYPHDRTKNRYISFDPNKTLNDGSNVAFEVTLEQLTLGSCKDPASGGTGGFCRQRCSESILQPCTVDADCPVGETCTTHDCNICTVDGNACLTESIDCAPDPSQTCDPTGDICVNDAPDAGGSNVGQVWCLGPEQNGIHLLVSVGGDGIPGTADDDCKVSADWPNPIHVGDCEIVPQARYSVYAVDVDSGQRSAALDVETATFEPGGFSSWGDGVGQLKKFCGGDVRTPECVDDNDCTPPQTCDLAWTLPNGVTDNDDINALLALIESPSSMPPPDVAWMDLHGHDSGLSGAHNVDPPNFRADFADVTNLVLAQYTRPYAFNDPADCPDVGAWPDPTTAPPPPHGSPQFTLVPNDDLLDPGQDLQVELYVSEATNVFAHEVALEVTGGTAGTLTVTDITVDQNRTDYVFYQIAAPLQAKDLPGMRVGSCLNTAGPGVTGSGQVYLATFTFQPTGGANGVFSINVVGDGRSFLLNPDGSAQRTDTSGTAVIGYGIDCLNDGDCNDNNECTTDACTAGNACQYTNVASGTACDDGLWCTVGAQECDGNGLCTGGTPRCPPGYLCDESGHQCFGAPPP